MKGDEGMSIGENIKRRRMEAKLTQEQLAEMVNIKRPMICQIERGTKIPSMALGKEIADALGCSMESLTI